MLCGICCLVLQGRSVISYFPRKEAEFFPETLIIFTSFRYIKFQNIVIFRFTVL